MDVTKAKRLKQHEDKNAKLKKILAEQMLDAAALRELLVKNGRALAAKCEGVAHLQAALASQNVGPATSSMLIARRSATGNVGHQTRELRLRLRELANERKRFGYRRLFVLLRQNGEPLGVNRIYRLYQEEGLTVREPPGLWNTSADPRRAHAECPLVG